MADFSDDSFSGIDWARSEPLPAFLARMPPLDEGGRTQIVDQAISLLEGYYVHLHQKRATHGVDPVRRLRALRRNLPLIGDDLAFHAAMHDVFAGLHDLHTVYTLPAQYAQMLAFLPFQVEAEHGPRFVVTNLVPSFNAPPFGRGVEVLDWNGVPIARAVARLATQSGGANADAAFARGVQALTLRPMVRMPPPEEDFVLIGWHGADGARQELRCEWRVCDLTPEPAHQQASGEKNAGLDVEGDALRRARKQLFAPHVVAAERAAEKAAAPVPLRGARAEDVTSSMPSIFLARRIVRPGRDIGYVRIRSFKTTDAGAFVAEFIRLIGALPRGGLIIDVRDNTGGLVAAAERTLQTLVPRPIEPSRVQFLATPEVLEMCRRTAAADVPVDLTQWIPSLEHALATGATYSAALPITPPAECNDIGQRYHGPAVLITNALCYSATDSFTAGFHDHQIGRILGTDGNTGAGGANVWSFAQVKRVLGDDAGMADLPAGSGLRVAIRRTLRVGELAGSEIEEVGIPPDETYAMTRDDLLNGNQGLIARACTMLEREQWYVLRLHGRSAETRGLDRLDVLLNDRPLASHDIAPEGKDHIVATPLGLPEGARGTLRLKGWREGKLVAALLEQL